MITSGSVHPSVSATSYPSVFFPSTRYGSFSVETSNQPSASLRRATSAPQSVINPSISVTCAPVCSHSTMFARGVSLGIKMKHSSPACAAYAAQAGLECFIFMPRDTPRANIVECEQTGAHVTLMDGLITDCGAEVARRKEAEGWFDVSTLKEPYRIEGKKSMGYELGEQLDWQLPDVILYPTGGGTGLIGMWTVSYTHLRAHETPEHLVCRLLLEKKKNR